MKIALATDKKGKMFDGHFGSCHTYQLYDWDDGKFKFIENRINKNSGKNSVASVGKSMQIIRQLLDCEVFIGWGFGIKSIPKIGATGIQALLTNEDDPEKNLRLLQNHEYEKFSVYNKTKNSRFSF